MYFESSQPFTFFTVHAIGQVPFCFLFITIHYTVYSTQYILPTLSNAHFFPLHACDCAVARQSNIYSTSYQPYQKFILYHVHACAVARQSNIYSTSYQLYPFFSRCMHAQWPDSPIFTLHPNNFIKSSFFFRCTHAQWRDSPIFYCYYIYLPRGTQRLILTSDVLPFAAK